MSRYHHAVEHVVTGVEIVGASVMVVGAPRCCWAAPARSRRRRLTDVGYRHVRSDRGAMSGAAECHGVMRRITRVVWPDLSTRSSVMTTRNSSPYLRRMTLVRRLRLSSSVRISAVPDTVIA
jgi:hypothetical protein